MAGMVRENRELVQTTQSMTRVTIRFWDGTECEAFLLLSHGLNVRLAVWGSDDALEFRYQGGQWFAESGQHVELEFHGEPADEYADLALDAWGESGSLGEGHHRTWLN